VVILKRGKGNIKMGLRGNRFWGCELDRNGSGLCPIPSDGTEVKVG
jgi:hypothetical protein